LNGARAILSTGTASSTVAASEPRAMTNSTTAVRIAEAGSAAAMSADSSTNADRDQGPQARSTTATGVHVNGPRAILSTGTTSGTVAASEPRAMTNSTAAVSIAEAGNAATTSIDSCAMFDRDLDRSSRSTTATGVHVNAAQSRLSPGTSVQLGSWSIARVRARHEIISPAYRRTGATGAGPASSPPGTSIICESTCPTAASRLDTTILHTQAKAALTGLGWKPAIAHAAVTAAATALGSDVTLERLVFEALRQCPRPLGTSTIPAAVARADR
jgi:hypothetical protein